MKTHKTAGCVLFNQTLDKIFLIYKKDRKEWLLPKGHIEDGEGLLDGAKREVFEETGYKDFVILGQTPVITNTFEFVNKVSKKMEEKTIYVFAAVILSDKNTHTEFMDAEGLGGEWLTVDEAMEKASYEDIKLAIQKSNDKIKNCGHHI